MILSLTISVIVGLQSSKTIPVEAINSIQTEPIAPLGGVLMVQLVSETLGNNWPSTIDVTFENRDKQTGHIGWIEKNTNNTSWTSNPYTIRPIAPSDNTQHIHPLDAMTGPVLLVELPRKSEGSIYFGGTSIDPLWVAYCHWGRWVLWYMGYLSTMYYLCFFLSTQCDLFVCLCFQTLHQ